MGHPLVWLCQGKTWPPVTPNSSWPGGHRHARSVDIELVQSAVRIVPGAVGIIRPCRMCDSAVERQPGVVAIIDAVPRMMGVRRSSAVLNVLRKRLPAVLTKGPPNLRIVIGDAVGVTRPSGTKIVAGVVPAERDVPGCGVKRNLWQELTIPGVVVVYPYARAPGRAVIVRIPDVDVHVVAFVLLLQRVRQVHSAVVRATGTVPSQARLGID